MKFPESWLTSMIDPALAGEALANLLTMSGFEVEAVEPVAPAFEGVVVGEVRALEPHPGADRLKVCRVDLGDTTVAVVCGAPNVRVGMRVACARPGARLPGGAIEAATIRGVASAGMLCSARELGLGADHGGLLELPGAARLGADVRAALELDDRVLTLKLTPNRGDCLSVLGLARELSALTARPYTPPQAAPVAAAIDDQLAIGLEAGPGCSRYCGRVIREVNVSAPTPAWMRRRLERCGLRPISAVVDITNYVMLELGQPLHAFDLIGIEGGIRVRYADAGESLELLDGRTVELDASHMVIADYRKALALAGVMGGAASAVSDRTQSVFLESAFFDPATVARAARALGIASDAAHRFERGVDFELARTALERASALVLEVCGGQAGPLTEATGRLPQRSPITLRTARVARVLGIEIGAEPIARMLSGLGLLPAAREGGFSVKPPSHRFDLEIEEDLIEEIARVHGYERIPATAPVAASAILPVPERRVSTHAVKRALAARDYFEVVTFSFVDRELEADFAGNADPVALMNPIASQMAVMRSTLIGSLVECVRFNVARKQDRLRVFEIARCFERGGEGFRQVERAAALAYGPVRAEQWGERARAVDFFDVRADLEVLLGPGRAAFEPATHPAFHPGQCARVRVQGVAVGWIGALNPRWLQKYELNAACVGFEIDLSILLERELPQQQPIPRYQPVRRDIAVVVDADVSAEAVHIEIMRAGAPLAIAATLFDVYAGEGVPSGRKSLAYRVLLQDTEKTLTDAEVEARVSRIVEVLKQKHNATLRS